LLSAASEGASGRCGGPFGRSQLLVCADLSLLVAYLQPILEAAFRTTRPRPADAPRLALPFPTPCCRRPRGVRGEPNVPRGNQFTSTCRWVGRRAPRRSRRQSRRHQDVESDPGTSAIEAHMPLSPRGHQQAASLLGLGSYSPYPDPDLALHHGDRLRAAIRLPGHTRPKKTARKPRRSACQGPPA
jgi:hypothetical protein